MGAATSVSLNIGQDLSSISLSKDAAHTVLKTVPWQWREYAKGSYHLIWEYPVATVNERPRDLLFMALGAAGLDIGGTSSNVPTGKSGILRMELPTEASKKVAEIVGLQPPSAGAAQGAVKA